MRRDKICFFVPFYPLIKGGAEYQSKIIATALKEQQYEIVYISSGHEKEQCIVVDGFKIYQLNVSSGIVEKASLYKNFMKKVCDIISKEAPNIIYQRILNTFTYRLAKFSKKNNIPFVLHIADNYSLEFDKGRLGILKKKLFKALLKNGPIIICQTAYQRNKITEFDYAVADVIPNMHPLLTETVPKKDRKKIIWIGNARPVKQLEVYLKLAKSFETSQLKFHIIGRIPENAYGISLQETIATGKNIVYHGGQDNDYVNSLLLNSGILINTSVSEGFSNTFIQAWMCGTPVLALNSDPDSIIKKNNIGVNCEGEQDRMKIALKELLENSDAYDLMCQKALRTAQSHFSVEMNMKRFVALLVKSN